MTKSNVSASPTFSTEAYLASDVKGKAALRSSITAAITAAITKGDLAEAQSLVAIQSTFTTPKATVEIDWNVRAADLAVTLRAAAALVMSGQCAMPEGVTVVPFEGLTDAEVTDLLNAATVDTALATKLATVSGRKAGRGAVVAYVDSVIGSDPMTIAQIRAAWTASSDYPKAPPSAGAIGAAFDRVEAGAEAGFDVVSIDGKRGAVSA